MDVDKDQEFDDDGKIILDDIYNKSDPRSYFTELGKLDYAIPQHAKPVFSNVLEAYKVAKGVSETKVLDLGCSYGVNAALLKNDLSMQDLYQLYAAEPAIERMARAELVERDQKLFRDGNAGAITVIGLDAAPQALAYAEEAGIIDAKVVADLESQDLTNRQQDLLAGTDLIVSTGCIGYISEKTIAKVLDADQSNQPWMAHFVLRMFAFEPIADVLAERGYVTAKGARSVVQRRFASDQEREQVLERLIDMGIDPSGLETDGWYHADLFVSRPAADLGLVPSPELTAI